MKKLRCCTPPLWNTDTKKATVQRNGTRKKRHGSEIRVPVGGWVTMETRTVTQREQESSSSRASHSMELSSQTKKRTFTSSDEEVPYSDFCPNIPADVIKEILNMENIPRHRTWEILRETLAGDEDYHRDEWTMFGNEAEKLEKGVIRHQRLLRTRVDKLALRKEAQKKASEHLRYLERLSQKVPDFAVPLRAHTVWEGMTVQLSCIVQGCPTPEITWYKDGKPLRRSEKPWNYGLQQAFGLNSLEIRRCSPVDGGVYKVVAKSPLGEAMTFATLVVNSYRGATAGCEDSTTRASQEAVFASAFPPTWVKECDSLTLSCSFTSPLLPFQQDITWFRDGIQLLQSCTVDIKTTNNTASITLSAVYKEHEGVYTVRLKTWDGILESSAYVYVEDASAAVVGGPGSPLLVQVTDVNKDYVFLTWQPPSADGVSPVEGYFIERCDLSQGQWVRCNMHLQKLCHYPVFGLKEGAKYQFRVRAVNQAGVGRPSKATEPVVTEDPLEHTRTMVVKVHRGRTIAITKDELEGQVRTPFPPTNVHACEVSDIYVVLSWTEPEPRGKEPLTFYVERSQEGKNTWELASLDVVVNSPRFPVFDLVKGTQYRFRVRAINKYGVSDPSEPSGLISLGKPERVPSPPSSLMVFRDTDTSVLLEWQEPKDKEGILGYYLYYSETGQGDWKIVNNKPVTDTRFTVHGLQTRKEYVLRVKSVSRAGNSDYSEESLPIVVKAAICVPSAPSAIALLLCTGSEMVLGWRRPRQDGGAPVRGYYLDQKEAGAETWREVNVKAVKERRATVSKLTSGLWYQFRVFATNMVGVGKPSDASEAFLCEKWTMAEPGCPFDLAVREVRNNSLVLLWAAPLYAGKDPVTGYFLEISQGGPDSDNWTALNEKPVTDTYYKVSGLQAGETYRLRVSAVNEAGTGRASLPSEAVMAQTPPDTKNIEVGVDDEGFIYLGYECDEFDESKCLWSKNYTEPIDDARAQAESKNGRSVLTFSDASAEDLGLYTMEMSDDPSQSSSYVLTAEDLERLKELSHQVRNPLIALKSGWHVEVSEKGEVRLWLQTESLSESAELRLIFNDKEISSTPHRKINFDKAEGLVEVLIDRLGREDEGSYTAQLRDGRARNQFTLVLVDQQFRELLALANGKRRDHERKSGPYFQEYLSWSVNKDCEVIIKCKVTNTTDDTTLRWFKDGTKVTQAVYDIPSGVSTLTIPQIGKKEAGSYKVVVSDPRGEDVSTLALLDEEFNKLLQQLSKQCAMSAGPLRVQSTAEGFRLYCSLKYYISYLKTIWSFKEKRMEPQARTRMGSNAHTVWMDIFNPTENDKGKYSLEMFDGQETHTRHLDLSGQAFVDALLEHQRLKQEAVTEKNRAKVTKGLPDVVAIMEGKSLCLTCFIEGDPDPDVFWLRNDRELPSEGQFFITKEPRCSTITINDVHTDNSGKYSVVVRNRCGSETVDVTVSVYKHGELPPANAVEMGL
ncbi:myomesin-3 isoform X2 [Dunckerocampus dactyliophorus]|uniref:myomesin-3 isoform X2 n=1 Tax=Dunckerocampus dactyliophorus TaxID=161453 RepID=UPI002404AC7C|nr:myomesin-3 isoform X2 [Dunckerocampus dactyliophorus]